MRRLVPTSEAAYDPGAAARRTAPKPPSGYYKPRCRGHRRQQARLHPATLLTKSIRMITEATKTEAPIGELPLWQEVLPVLQEINSYGGNFIGAFVSR